MSAPWSTLTEQGERGTLTGMVVKLQLLDPERRRRRLQLLARLADGKAARNTASPGRARPGRVRDIIALRRRWAG
jgi:hypothetical protein